MKGKRSPCVNVCEYRGKKGWCTECGMTCEESMTWCKMKPYDRNALLKELHRRLKTKNGAANNRKR